MILFYTQVSKAPSAPVPPSPAPAPGLTKRVKKSKQPLQVTKDLGRWKPADDLLLINAVLQVVCFHHRIRVPSTSGLQFLAAKLAFEGPVGGIEGFSPALRLAIPTWGLADQRPDISPPGRQVQLPLHSSRSPGALVRSAVRSCHLQVSAAGSSGGEVLGTTELAHGIEGLDCISLQRRDLRGRGSGPYTHWTC